MSKKNDDISNGEYKDDRSWFTHKIHEYGHRINAYRKREGKTPIESQGWYRVKSPKKYRENGWDVKVDDERAEYHRRQAEEKGCIVY